MELEVNRVFSYYFKEEPVLAKYATLGLEALKNGDSCVVVDSEDKVLLESSKLISKQESDLSQPFVMIGDKFYFQRYLGYENIIFETVNRLLDQSITKQEKRKELLKISLIQSLFDDFTLDNDLSEVENINWQQMAVIIAYLNDFTILTGGPGTGKTTTVSKFLAILFDLEPNVRVALGAQTGKASARLKESLDNSLGRLNISDTVKQRFEDIVPSTMHRLLGYKPNSVDFRHNKDNTLPYDVVILDESSMIDLPMMAKLMEAIGEHTRLILLGDKNQLASVEIGSVFGDLCEVVGDQINTFSTPVFDYLQRIVNDTKFEEFKANKGVKLLDYSVELKRSYRFSSVKGLGLFSSKILEGNIINLLNYNVLPENEGVYSGSDFEDDILSDSLLSFKSYIHEVDIETAIDKFNDYRVLSATREGKYGVHELNNFVESKLRKHKLINTKKEFYIHRPIMITKNDYNLGLYNGDIGLVRKDSDGEIKVFFKDIELGLKAINPSFLRYYQTVFAMTIHKSQGSEFKDVLLVLPENTENNLLNRQLLYTAVTRAKEKVFILGTQEVFDVSIAQLNERQSNLKNRF